MVRASLSLGIKKERACREAPVAQLSHFGSSPDLTVRGFEPRVGLCAHSSEPGACFRFCVCLSLPDSPFPHSCSVCLSLSKINKH